MAQQYIGTGTLEGTTSVVTVTGTSAQSSAFGSQTRKIRISGNTAAHAKVGSNPTAVATTDPFFPANSTEYLTVTPGQKIAFIRALTDGLVTVTSGTWTVTELA